MVEAEALAERARQDYGNLIATIKVWPPGLGIDVHLIGGEVVQYLPSGQRHVVDQPSTKELTLRKLARFRGVVHRLTRRS